MTPELRIHAKKSLGQNFLANPGVIARIIAAAETKKEDVVLEIGPGTGALTSALAATGARVIALEKDRRLLEPLRAAFPPASGVTIAEGDALRIGPAFFADYGMMSGRWKLVANIPYYLTSHLLRLLTTTWPRPERAVLMVQREVADRLMATPPAMNLLALAVQSYAHASRVMRVSPGSFRPSPSVESAVILLRPLPDADAAGIEHMLAIAKRAFARKRKQLGGIFPPELLRSVGVEPGARPQELGLDSWRAIASVLP